MTILTKTIAAGELPADWQRELGLAADRMVKVEIAEAPEQRSQAEIDRLIGELKAIVPVESPGDATALIRAERDRIDGRSTGP